MVRFIKKKVPERNDSKVCVAKLVYTNCFHAQVPFHLVATQGNLWILSDLSEVFTGLFVAVQVGLLLHGSSHFQVRLSISPLLHTCPSSGLPFLCLKSNLLFSLHLVYTLLS